MFGYLDNEYNPSRVLVLETPSPSPGALVRYIPYSTSIVVDLPDTVSQLRARQSGKFWKEIARRQRRFEESYGSLHFDVIRDREKLEFWLPRVQELFAERWHDEYTSIPWKSSRGFRPYQEAMIELARQGRACLPIVHANQELLSFRYCLAQDDWYYSFQHATTPRASYRAYGIGKHILVKLLTYLVEQTDCRHLDLGIGDTEYKREWESWRRTVYLRLESTDTASGRIRLAALTAFSRTKLYVQFSNPALRSAAKSLLLPVQHVSDAVRGDRTFARRHFMSRTGWRARPFHNR